jgi:hypothetical protein
MRKTILAALAAAGLAAATTGMSIAPASAHHPSYIWWHGYQYWAADYYAPAWCIYHHKWIYCRKASY